MIFPEVRVEVTPHNGRVRIRAKGIGPVFQSQPDRADFELIYYRVNGVTEGSLDGTPFEPGGTLPNGTLDGLFF